MDCIVHGVAKSQTRLSDFHFHFTFTEAGGIRDSIPGLGRSPGEEHSNHSHILAWRIPRTEEPGGLQSWGRKESDMTEATEHAHEGGAAKKPLSVCVHTAPPPPATPASCERILSSKPLLVLSLAGCVCIPTALPLQLNWGITSSRTPC